MLPYDYLVKTNLLYKKLLYKFVKNIIKEKFFNLKKQNKKKATYYPRLNTEKNGIIDWSWNIYQIERFIRAFHTHILDAEHILRKKVFIIKNSKIKK